MWPPSWPTTSPAPVCSEPIPFDSLPSRPYRHAQINFSDWRLLGTGSLVIGTVTPSLDGNYVVEYQLYDVLRRKQIVGFPADRDAEPDAQGCASDFGTRFMNGSRVSAARSIRGSPMSPRGAAPMATCTMD